MAIPEWVPIGIKTCVTESGTVVATIAAESGYILDSKGKDLSEVVRYYPKESFDAIKKATVAPGSLCDNNGV